MANNSSDVQRIRLTVHEVIGVGTVVVAITTSFLFLRADVLVLSKDVSTLQTNVQNITVEQAKMKTVLDLVYEDGQRNKNRNDRNDQEEKDRKVLDKH
ncbi:hypothetical protein HOO68_05765 [Candidatus Gracilibacteria bacterium]|nr:hypothetical protein [Candidatus Gracilibacteria bacterium]